MDDLDLGHDEPDAAIGSISRCPACRSTDLRTVIDGESANFSCGDCYRCWHVELNWVIRVDPTTCAGCRTFVQCAERFMADHREAPRVAK